MPSPVFWNLSGCVCPQARVFTAKIKIRALSTLGRLVIFLILVLNDVASAWSYGILPQFMAGVALEELLSRLSVSVNFCQLKFFQSIVY